MRPQSCAAQTLLAAALTLLACSCASEAAMLFVRSGCSAGGASSCLCCDSSVTASQKPCRLGETQVDAGPGLVQADVAAAAAARGQIDGMLSSK